MDTQATRHPTPDSHTPFNDGDEDTPGSDDADRSGGNDNRGKGSKKRTDRGMGKDMDMGNNMVQDRVACREAVQLQQSDFRSPW